MIRSARKHDATTPDRREVGVLRRGLRAVLAGCSSTVIGGLDVIFAFSFLRRNWIPSLIFSSGGSDKPEARISKAANQLGHRRFLSSLLILGEGEGEVARSGPRLRVRSQRLTLREKPALNYSRFEDKSEGASGGGPSFRNLLWAELKRLNSYGLRGGNHLSRRVRAARVRAALAREYRDRSPCC